MAFLLLCVSGCHVPRCAQSKSGYSALMRGAYNGHTAIVKALLSAGATIDLQVRHRKRARIHGAVCLAAMRVVRGQLPVCVCV